MEAVAHLADMKRAASAEQKTSLLPYPHQEEVKKLAASQNNFTRDFYVKLAQKNSENVFFSPFSIMTALGMTHSGTAGNTERELHTVLHLSQSKEEMHIAFQDVLTDLKADVADYELRTSNLVYVADRMPVLSGFAKTLQEKYLSSSKAVNFAEGEQVRQQINADVENETNSRIKGLMPSGILNSLTAMVLVNAVYFKGLWEEQFKTTDTHDGKFWISESESIKVPMMHIKKIFRMQHNKDLGATLLAMNYKGSRLSMVFVLPDKRDGLAELEAKLATVQLLNIDKDLKQIKAEVTIPKFKLEESLDLVDHLTEMGIRDLFSRDNCNLIGITGVNDLYVTHVLHKAFVEVNEKGSEAAAATAVVIKWRSLPPPTPRFTADHPFFFIIRDQHSGLILFAGRLAHP